MAINTYQATASSFTFTAWATASAVDHPPSNLALQTAPYRTWRSRSLASGQERIVIQLALPLGIATVYLTNANFAAVSIYTSIDGGWTWVSQAASQAVTRDPRTGRRQAWIAFSAVSNVTHVRLDCATPDAGATYFELGSVSVSTSAVPFSDNPQWPVRCIVHRAATRLDYLTGGGEVHEDGRAYVELTMGSGVFDRRTTIVTELFKVIDFTRATPFVLYENRGNTAQAYFLRRVDDAEITERVGVASTSLTFVECI